MYFDLFFINLDGALKFTLEPPDPSYVRNGRNARLVWDYSVDNQADLDGIIYSVQVSGGYFSNMLGLQSDGTVVNFPSTPNKYKGRVRIEGRASLVIENITSQDNTSFMCTLVAKPGAGSDVRSQVQLIVTGLYNSFVFIALIHFCMMHIQGSTLASNNSFRPCPH